MTNFILTTHDANNPLLQALRAEGADVRYVQWDNLTYGELVGCKGFYGNLFDEIKRWPLFIAKRNMLRRLNVPYIFWNRDAPWNVGIKRRNAWFLKQIKPVDIYLAHSLQDAAAFGGSATHFPNAAQPAYYESTDLDALNDEASYKYDVSFFGSAALGKDRNSRERHQFLSALQDQFAARNSGIRFKWINTAEQPMSIADQLDFIRTSKINLNLGAMCDLPGNTSWGLPERVFGIPAAGGFLLTEKRKMLGCVFTNEPASFTNLDECAHKVQLVLRNFHRLRYQAGIIHAEVVGAHTYKHRAVEFIRLLEKNGG